MSKKSFYKANQKQKAYLQNIDDEINSLTRMKMACLSAMSLSVDLPNDVKVIWNEDYELIEQPQNPTKEKPST